MSELTVKQKKSWAKTLYINEHITQNEIAERVKVAPQTLSRWVRSEQWEKLKTSVTITREEQLANLYRQVAEINDGIAKRDEGERYANSKEADIINKLAASIDKMERETGLSETISVSKNILKFIRKSDPEKAKELSFYFDDFIKEMLNEHKA